MHLNVITRKSAILALLLLVVMLVATAIRYTLAPFGMELANGVADGGMLSLVVAVLVLLYSGFIEGKMLARAGLSGAYCTLPMPIYGVLACGVFIAPDLLATAATSLCFAMALYLLLRSLHNADEKDSVFFASLLLGTTVLFYPPSVVLVAVIPIAIFTLALSLRQSLIMVVGYLLPILTASYISWYGGEPFIHFGEELFSSLLTSQMAPIGEIPYVAIAILASALVILVWGAIYALVSRSQASILTRVRRAIHFFLFVLLLSITMALVPACDLSALAIIAVPATILLSYVLEILPNNHSAIAYWVLLALSAIHLFVA